MNRARRRHSSGAATVFEMLGIDPAAQVHIDFAGATMTVSEPEPMERGDGG